ncbi:hypothetical protein Pint_08106 [Pistacia integerrima]|uniref:Uncharacterized protein n=1 Tax=Pistacia integerrima TaxID=434235 RepID=A0ACC0XW25_9ROSI|nr:hypothetical protein Pint_08106 [Pistacia integerrima]
MTHLVTMDEVRKARFDIGDDKAPGPDGYSAKFFKESKGIIGEETFKAIIDFFNNGRLLKEVNATVIALVSKVEVPLRVSDFKPISCCNVLYKCISKIIANRIVGCLVDLVDESQTAFMPRRWISDNVLLA